MSHLHTAWIRHWHSLTNPQRLLLSGSNNPITIMSFDELVMVVPTGTGA